MTYESKSVQTLAEAIGHLHYTVNHHLFIFYLTMTLLVRCSFIGFVQYLTMSINLNQTDSL